jgi:hypothetical protein
MNIQARPPRPPLNGVDTPTLLSTIAFVAGQPELAAFSSEPRTNGSRVPTVEVPCSVSTVPEPNRNM